MEAKMVAYNSVLPSVRCQPLWLCGWGLWVLGFPSTCSARNAPLVSGSAEGSLSPVAVTITAISSDDVALAWLARGLWILCNAKFSRWDAPPFLGSLGYHSRRFEHLVDLVDLPSHREARGRTNRRLLPSCTTKNWRRPILPTTQHGVVPPWKAGRHAKRPVCQHPPPDVLARRTGAFRNQLADQVSRDQKKAQSDEQEVTQLTTFFFF